MSLNHGKGDQFSTNPRENELFRMLKRLSDDVNNLKTQVRNPDKVEADNYAEVQRGVDELIDTIRVGRVKQLVQHIVQAKDINIMSLNDMAKAKGLVIMKRSELNSLYDQVDDSTLKIKNLKSSLKSAKKPAPKAFLSEDEIKGKAPKADKGPDDSDKKKPVDTVPDSPM